jgi:glycopeptide antibiotics resistance protein
MFLKHLKWAILWALFILILCGMPGRDIPHISFLELLSFDKFVHASLFFVLLLLMIRGFLLQTTFVKLQLNAKRNALIIGVLYGGLIEILQGLVFIERSADIFDFFANSFGAICAVLLYPRLEKLILKKFIK